MDSKFSDCGPVQRYHLHPVSSLPVHFGRHHGRSDGFVFVFRLGGCLQDVRLGEHDQRFCYGVHQSAWNSESFWDGVFEEKGIQYLHDNWVLGDRDADQCSVPFVPERTQFVHNTADEGFPGILSIR